MAIRTIKTALTDLDKMPWGKFQGVVMQDVPTDYLHFLWHEYGLKHQNNPVANYIRNSMSVLESENPDLIWE